MVDNEMCTVPLFLFVEGHMHLYPFIIKFQATDLLKQYLKFVKDIEIF